MKGRTYNSNQTSFLACTVKKTFATFLCQNSGTILIITYVFCYQSNFLFFAGEHWLARSRVQHQESKVQDKFEKTMEARTCHFRCGKMCLTWQQSAGSRVKLGKWCCSVFLTEKLTNFLKNLPKCQFQSDFSDLWLILKVFESWFVT